MSRGERGEVLLVLGEAKVTLRSSVRSLLLTRFCFFQLELRVSARVVIIIIFFLALRAY